MFRDAVRLRRATAGTLLLREGQMAEKGWFISTGTARAYYVKEGKDISDWFAFDAEFITAPDSFLAGLPSPHHIELLSDAVLIEFQREWLQQECDRNMELGRLLRVVLTRTLLRLQQRIVSLQFESAAQKYHNLLRVRPDITQRVPLGHIASYLGITQETLSRIRARF
ncbi:MAG: Crp/Fnr family transcriptional regulator [Flavobacteriales bacterium]